MKHPLSLLLGLLLTTAVVAQDLPSQTDILSDMLKVNAHFMSTAPDPGAPTFGGGKERTSNLWTRAV